MTTATTGRAKAAALPADTCPPRFATPRDESRDTLGPKVGEVAARLGKPLMPWQQLVADVALELDPDGSFHYDELVLTVPRQSGKTSLILALIVHRLVVMARALGAQRVTYTAQLRAKARLKLERDFSDTLRQARSFREITHLRARPVKPTEWKLSLNNGAEHILFGRGNYLQIDAPSRTGGHGDTLDLGVIDEAFAHIDDTVEAGMDPSMITRVNRLLAVLSTAGDASSKYLWRKVKAGREACESGNHGRTCYFEWSAPDDADPSDPAVWAACSPALGITITMRALEGQWAKAVRGGQEGIDKFRRAYLNQWPEIPVIDDEAEPQWLVIPQAAWIASGPDEDDDVDALVADAGEMLTAIDVDTDADGVEWCSLGVSDGWLLQDVTPIDAGPGTGWLLAKAKQRFGRGELSDVWLDPAGAAAKLIDPLEDIGITVHQLKAAEKAQASMQMFDAVMAAEVMHLDQPRVNAAVAGLARKDVGDGAFRFSRSLSSADVSTFMALTIARWAAASFEGGEPDVY